MENSLVIAGLSAAYGHVRALDDVSLTVGSGETVALMAVAVGREESVGAAL